MVEMIIPYPQLKKILEETCELDVYKVEAERMMDIVEKKLADLFEVAYEKAKAERREEIMLRDLPLTKGFLASMELFRKAIERQNVDVEPIKKFVLRSIPVEVPLQDELVDELPIITGTLFVLIGRVIKALHPDVERVKDEHIEEAKRVLDYTL
jgi:histone H3/H4